MQIADLDKLALRPTAWPRNISGYVEYTERFAATADASQALAGQADFDRAALGAWFATGYLGALSRSLPESAAPPRRPAPQDLPLLHDLLLWLAPVHASARDNCDTVDTANLADTFRHFAETALAGTQFRLSVPLVGQGRPLFPALSSDPLPLAQPDVTARSVRARDRIEAVSVWLGRRHRRRKPLRRLLARLTA